MDRPGQQETHALQGSIAWVPIYSSLQLLQDRHTGLAKQSPGTQLAVKNLANECEMSTIATDMIAVELC
eukprot:2012355-Amphidinium_carterae.1